MALNPVSVPSINETDAVRQNTAIRQLAERLATASAELDSIQTALSNYLRVDAPQSFTPTQQAQGRSNLNINAGTTPSTAVGGISATNVQSAIAELDTEKVAKAGDTMSGSLSMAGGSYVFSNTVWEYNYALDTTPVTRSVANGAIIVIENNFSGAILVNNWNTNGHVAMYLVGGGVVSGFGSTTSYSCVAAPAQNGYAVYNATGASGVFSVAAIRTRSGA